MEAEPPPLSVLDLLSDDAAGLDSALPPSFDVPFGDVPFGDVSFGDVSFGDVSFGDVSFDDATDSFAAGSFDPDSELAAFFRASDG